MIFKLTNISVILFITTLLNFFTTYISWQRRNTKGGVFFAFGMMGITLWTLASGFDYAAVPLQLKIFFAKLETVGYSSALSFLLLTALSYGDYAEWFEKRPLKVIFFMIPITISLLAWTNELHGLFWSGFKRSTTSDNIVIFEHGPGFTGITVIGYLMVTAIIVSLWMASRRGSEIPRRQARLLLFASIIPVISNAIYLLDLPGYSGVDWTSITFSISGLLFLIALYGTRFLDIAPIARHTVFSKMTDPVLVLDADNQILDFNKAAAQYFRFRTNDLGKPLSAVRPNWPEIEDFVSSNSDTAINITITVKEITRVFNIRLTSLEDERKQVYGKLLSFRDITERKRMEELDQFRAELWEYAASHSLDTLMQMALDKICDLTKSPIGFYHFVEEDQKTLSLQAWSTRTLEEFCQAEGEGLHYNIDEAGIWVDAFYQQKPVIHNDYAALPYRKGLPEGHAEVIRQLVVPVLRDKRVVSILGVGNKPSDYDENDSELVSAIADLVWTIVSHKRSDEQLKQAQEQLVKQQRELAINEERQRMARDLHDSLSQSIHSMVLFSETLGATIKKQNFERAAQIMERLQESARQSHKETRLLLYQLQAEGPERSVNLVQDLEERLAKVERHSGVRTQVIQEGSLEHLPLEWHTKLFWIAIEALNNALKHAQARKVQVEIRCSPQNIELKVQDDGVGFEATRVAAGGLGLENMRARADIIGGELTIETKPSQGTTVRLIADLDPKRLRDL